MLKTLRDFLSMNGVVVKYVQYPTPTLVGLPGMIPAVFYRQYRWTSDSGEQYWEDRSAKIQDLPEDRQWLALNGWEAETVGLWFRFTRKEEGA